MLEVGTHWIFGLLEVTNETEVDASACCCHYDLDGPDGILCESGCSGYLTLAKSGFRVIVDIQTTSEEAANTAKDIYELHVIGEATKSLVLYDLSKLRDGVTGEDIVIGNYGRRECVSELVKAITTKDRDGANLVTAAKAQNVQEDYCCHSSR